MSTKQLHSTDSTTFLQNIAYTYNERGWLLSSNAPLFQMQFQYNNSTISNVSITPQYNGNIASQSWGTSTAPNQNSYVYQYDRINRLLAANNSTTGNSENNITYDKMGNITQLYRYQAGAALDLQTYNYTNSGNSTNQLQSISNADGNDTVLPQGTWNYTYDGNGNLTTDPSKGASGISITYNMLNLPQNITGSKTITYTYDATGQKLRRVSPITGKTDYISGIQYDDNNTGTETISFIQTEEGKAVPTSSGYDYTYYMGDNLGNTRITFDTQTGAALIQQKDDYYAFGREIAGSITSPKNEYLYNSKELQEETGLYDYGHRYLDPVIGRWTTIDELAEKYSSMSPYNYVADDPINKSDPDGKRIIFDPSASATFRKQFAQAVKYLNAHGAGGMLAKLQARKEVIKIGMLDADHKVGTFSPKNKEIYWDPTAAAITDKGIILSPASVLNHETDHALDYVTDPQKHTERTKEKDLSYGNQEEKRVITGSEQETAKKLGEIKDGEVTRTDHEGTDYKVTGPTITTGQNEAIVRPEKPKKKDEK